MGYKSIGKQLLQAREEAGFSQEQLAAKLGCSQSTLSNYEKGKRRIYLAHLEKIAEILSKPVQFFLQPLGQESIIKLNDEIKITEKNLLVLFRSLSQEGQQLLIDFALWVRNREVDKNG